MPDLFFQLLLLLLIAVLLRLDFVYYLIYVLAGVAIAARWWTSRNLAALRISRRFTDHIFTRETTTVELTIENRGWLPIPWLRCIETPPPALSTGEAIHDVLALHPKGRAILRYTINGRRRGFYTLGPTAFQTGDLFGFAQQDGRFESREHLVVYPRIIPLAHVNISSHSPLGTIKSRQPIFTDPTRVIGVRPYAAGDPPHSIAWKNSAHTGALQVKKCEPAVSLASMIFLDLNPAAYSRRTLIETSEWAIVVAGSLAGHLIEQRQEVGLASNGHDPLTDTRCWRILPRPGRAHLIKLLEWLARVEPAATAPLADWLSTATVGLAWGTTIIAITAGGDEATCSALHRLLRNGLNPVLIAVEPHARFDVVRDRARRLGIAAHLLADEHDLTLWGASRVPRLS